MDDGVLMSPTEDAIAPDELARAPEGRDFESVWFPEHPHIPASRRSPWPEGELWLRFLGGLRCGYRSLGGAKGELKGR